MCAHKIGKLSNICVPKLWYITSFEVKYGSCLYCDCLQEKKSEKCLLEIAKFQFNEKSWLILLHYTFFLNWNSLGFSVPPNHCGFLLLPHPSAHTRLIKEYFFLMECEKNHSQFPNCFVPTEYYMGGPTNIDPPELGVLPPQDLKLWPPTNLHLWVFISCGEMMCLSLPRSLPGVYQHYSLSSSSVIFL